MIDGIPSRWTELHIYACSTIIIFFSRMQKQFLHSCSSQFGHSPVDLGENVSLIKFSFLTWNKPEPTDLKSEFITFFKTHTTYLSFSPDFLPSFFFCPLSFFISLILPSSFFYHFALILFLLHSWFLHSILAEFLMLSLFSFSFLPSLPFFFISFVFSFFPSLLVPCSFLLSSGGQLTKGLIPDLVLFIILLRIYNSKRIN